MTEKSPPNSDKKDPLFYMGPGYQGDTVRYPEDVEPSEPYQDTDPGPPKKLLEMTPQEMIEVALLDRVVPDIYGHIDPKRDEFTRAGHHWTPYSEMEVTSAIGTDRFSNPPLVAYVLGAQRNGGREIQDLRTGEFNPKGARFNPYVIQVLAKAIFARNSFNLFDWPNHYLERSKRIKPNPKVDTALQGISDKLPTLSDEELSFLCQRTLVHQQARLAFFADQMDKVKEHADTEDIATAARIHV
jgi:hypothetical protein